MMRRLLLTALAFGGCAHRAAISSDPPGAAIHVRGHVAGTTPGDVRMAWWPWRTMEVRVQSAGYRAVDLRLTRDTGPIRLTGEALTLHFGRLLGQVPRASHEVVLVKLHGPAGTWGEGDAP
jgi:hypothetical protein